MILFAFLRQLLLAVSLVGVARSVKQLSSRTKIAMSATAEVDVISSSNTSVDLTDIFNRLEELVAEHNQRKPPMLFSLNCGNGGIWCGAGAAPFKEDEINFESRAKRGVPKNAGAASSSQQRAQAGQAPRTGQAGQARGGDDQGSKNMSRTRFQIRQGITGSDGQPIKQVQAAPSSRPDFLNSLIEGFMPGLPSFIYAKARDAFASSVKETVQTKTYGVIEQLELPQEGFKIVGDILSSSMDHIQSSRGKIGDGDFWQGLAMGVISRPKRLPHPFEPQTYPPEDLFAFIRIVVKLTNMGRLRVDVRVKSIEGILKIIMGPCMPGDIPPFRGLTVAFDPAPNLDIDLEIHAVDKWVPFDGHGFVNGLVMGIINNILANKFVFPNRIFKAITPDPEGQFEQYFDWRSGNQRPAYLLLLRLSSNVAKGWINPATCAEVKFLTYNFDTWMKAGETWDVPAIAVPVQGDKVAVTVKTSVRSGYVFTFTEVGQLQAMAGSATEAGVSHAGTNPSNDGSTLDVTFKRFPLEPVQASNAVYILRVEIHRVVGLPVKAMKKDEKDGGGYEQVSDPPAEAYTVKVCIKPSGQNEECKTTNPGADDDPVTGGIVAFHQSVDFLSGRQQYARAPEVSRVELIHASPNVMCIGPLANNRGTSMQEVPGYWQPEQRKKAVFLFARVRMFGQQR